MTSTATRGETSTNVVRKLGIIHFHHEGHEKHEAGMLKIWDWAMRFPKTFMAFMRFMVNQPDQAPEASPPSFAPPNAMGGQTHFLARLAILARENKK